MLLIDNCIFQLWEEEGTICLGCYKEGYNKDEILKRTQFKDICDRIKIFFDKETDELVGIEIIGLDVILEVMALGEMSPDERERIRVEKVKEALKRVTRSVMARERKKGLETKDAENVGYFW